LKCSVPATPARFLDGESGMYEDISRALNIFSIDAEFGHG
jgi:hypothetical protein